MKTLILSLILAVAGGATLWVGTDGGRAFTTQTARRIEVWEHPRMVPNWHLQNQDGRPLALKQWQGRYVVVDFIYTSCAAACPLLGMGMLKLQQEFKKALEQDRLQLLSVSFDPKTDTPKRLRAHLSHFSAHGENWVAARPTHPAEKKAILNFFGVTVIPNEAGGYTHSAGYYIINPEGQLVAAFGLEKLAKLKDYLTKVLARENHGAERTQRASRQEAAEEGSPSPA